MIPCERVVYRILPAVRTILARELAATGLDQDEVADRLGITQPAVSKYLAQGGNEQTERIRAHEESWNRLRDVVDRVVEGHVLEEGELAEICHGIAADLPPLK